jgi:hypothetical protein
VQHVLATGMVLGAMGAKGIAMTIVLVVIIVGLATVAVIGQRRRNQNRSQSGNPAASEPAGADRHDIGA